MTHLAQLSQIAALRYSVGFCCQMADLLDAPTVIKALIVDQMEPAGEAIAQSGGVSWAADLIERVMQVQSTPASSWRDNGGSTPRKILKSPA